MIFFQNVLGLDFNCAGNVKKPQEFVDVHSLDSTAAFFTYFSSALDNRKSQRFYTLTNQIGFGLIWSQKNVLCLLCKDVWCVELKSQITISNDDIPLLYWNANFSFLQKEAPSSSSHNMINSAWNSKPWHLFSTWKTEWQEELKGICTVKSRLDLVNSTAFHRFFKGTRKNSIEQEDAWVKNYLKWQQARFVYK